MKTYSRLALTFLLLILVVPPVGADDPPKDGKHVEYYENGQKSWESHYKDGEKVSVESLERALKQSMQAGNLDEANKINAAIKALKKKEL